MTMEHRDHRASPRLHSPGPGLLQELHFLPPPPWLSVLRLLIDAARSFESCDSGAGETVVRMAGDAGRWPPLIYRRGRRLTALTVIVLTGWKDTKPLVDVSVENLSVALCVATVMDGGFL